MPTSKRGKLKRKHDAAINSLTEAQGYLRDLYDMFENVHPLYAEGYINIGILIEQPKKLIAKMRGFI